MDKRPDFENGFISRDDLLIFDVDVHYDFELSASSIAPLGLLLPSFTDGYARSVVQITNGPVSATAPAAVFELSSLQAANGGDGSSGTIFNGIDAGDRSGQSVSGAGDINGDGFDDFIIGASRANEPGSDSGESYLVFGTNAGFGASFNLFTLDGSNGFILNGVTRFDFSGAAVSSAGDLNGDGFDDIIIGASRAGNINGDDFAGQSYVVFGSNSGFGANFNLSSLDGSNGFTIDGIDEDDFSGSAISSAGDINGDGFDDIIIGAFGADSNGINDAGESYVVFGSDTGFTARLDLSTLNGTNGFVINGINAFDRSGQSVSSAGDINGDGFDDVIIGAPNLYRNSLGSVGESYVVFGNNAGFPARLDVANLDGANGFVIKGTNGSDGSGRSVSSAGDVNGDGIDDVIIGAPYVDHNEEDQVGESYVVFGTTSGFGATFLLTQLDGTNGFAIKGIDAGDRSGAMVSSAGDVNGDGCDDILIAAPRAYPGGNNRAGESYVVFGSSAGFAANLDLSALNGTNGFVINGIDEDDFSGSSISSAGDINSDGFDDIIIGARGAAPNGDDDAGESYVIYGRAEFGRAIETLTPNDDFYTATAPGEVVNALAGNDDITGSSGSDFLFGDEGDDILSGSSGNDVLDGGDGDDVVSGGDGDDVINDGAGIDMIDGGSGYDTVNYELSANGVIVFLSAGDGTGDVLSNVEIVIGSLGDDMITGDAFNNTFFGNNGDDILLGDAGDDSLSGGLGADLIIGGDGNDTIEGGADDDQLSGSLGDDTIMGGAGIDNILGGAGLDVISGGSGNDVVNAGSGDDAVNGDDGDDDLSGGTGADTILGGSGNDTINGNNDDDTLIGGEGDDLIDGGAGDDVLNGEAGDDVVFGRGGNDRLLHDGFSADMLSGDGGNDTFVIRAGGALTIDGGTGLDDIRLHTSASLAGATFANIEEMSFFNFGRAVVDAGALETIGLFIEGSSQIRIAHATAGSTDLTGKIAAGSTGRFTVDNTGANTFSVSDATGDWEFFGNTGDDTLIAGRGNDLLRGEQGNDTLIGGAGQDTLIGVFGDDFLYGGGDDDTLRGESGSDHIEGGDGNDLIFGGNQSDMIFGQDGDDTANGGIGNDTLDGGGGNDTLTGEDGLDILIGGAGNDKLFGNDGADNLDGGDGDDVLDGGGDNDVLFGGLGDDIMLGGGGQDELSGGDGIDFVIGGGGNDSISGDEGNDQLSGQAGNDLINGGLGDDSILGGSGGDDIFGGDGVDTVNAGGGDDTVNGDAGDDDLSAGAGFDTVFGGDGNDTIFGNNQDDILIGRDGDDTLDGGGGNDTLNGGRDNDTLFGRASQDELNGDAGDDFLFGNSGGDTLDGGGGNDVLEGGGGNDTLTGGTGIDVFVLSSGFGVDRITDFTSSLDQVDFSANTQANTFEDVIAAATKVGANVRIEFNANNIIVLENFDLADLDASDFIF